MIITTYDKVRNNMDDGDCIVSNGWGHNTIEFFYSCGIKLVTGPPTHISTVVIKDDGPYLWESMWHGQEYNSLDERIKNAAADHWQQIWWLPLSRKREMRFNYEAFRKYVDEKEGTKYDAWQGVRSGFPRLCYNKPDDTKLFCSESHMFALRAAGVVGAMNPSMATPVDVCEFNIHEECYSIWWRKDMFNKQPKELTINTKEPEGWMLR